jgi:hypothetical protein
MQYQICASIQAFSSRMSLSPRKLYFLANSGEVSMREGAPAAVQAPELSMLFANFQQDALLSPTPILWPEADPLEVPKDSALGDHCNSLLGRFQPPGTEGSWPTAPESRDHLTSQSNRLQVAPCSLSLPLYSLNSHQQQASLGREPQPPLLSELIDNMPAQDATMRDYGPVDFLPGGDGVEEGTFREHMQSLLGDPSTSTELDEQSKGTFETVSE